MHYGNFVTAGSVTQTSSTDLAYTCKLKQDSLQQLFKINLGRMGAERGKDDS